MALTTTVPISGYNISGSRRTQRGTGNLGTYSTNGVSYTDNKFGMRSVELLKILPANGYVFEVNYTSKLIIARREANDGTGGTPLEEVPNGIDLSGVTFTYEAAGI